MAGQVQISTLKRDQPHHSPQKTSYAVLSSESSSHTGYICVLAVSPAQLFPSLVPYLLPHYTVPPHKGSILHTSMRASDGHTRRDAVRWKGPNTKRTSVAWQLTAEPSTIPQHKCNGAPRTLMQPPHMDATTPLHELHDSTSLTPLTAYYHHACSITVSIPAPPRPQMPHCLTDNTLLEPP